MIHVDVASVKKFWNRYSTSAKFALALDVTSDELDENQLRLRSKETTEALSDAGNLTVGGQWVHTPKGWSGVLLVCPDFDDALSWLERFAGAWPDVDGKIVGGPRNRRPWSATMPVRPGLLTHMLMTMPDLTQMSRAVREGVWHVDPVTTRHLAAQSLAWQHVVGGTNWLDRDAGWMVETMGLNHAEAIAEAAERYGPARLASVRNKLLQRAVELRPPGNVEATSGPDEDWRETLDRHRDLLTCSPSRTQYGYVRHSHLGGGDYGLDWPHIDAHHLRYYRPLFATYVPDAFGLQLLTDAHLERAHDLSDWDITTLTDGHHLVAANNVEAWFGPPPERDPRSGSEYGPNPLPDDKPLVAKARADFGPMILTPEIVEDHNPWPDWPN